MIPRVVVGAGANGLGPSNLTPNYAEMLKSSNLTTCCNLQDVSIDGDKGGGFSALEFFGRARQVAKSRIEAEDGQKAQKVSRRKQKQCPLGLCRMDE